MNPERIAEMKKAIKTSYTKRRKRLVTTLKARVDQYERQKPKTLEEAVEIARQSKRWRNRLRKFVKLKATFRPTHVLMVDLWGKKTLFRAGTEVQLRKLIDEDPSLAIAGYNLVIINDLLKKVEQKGER